MLLRVRGTLHRPPRWTRRHDNIAVRIRTLYDSMFATSQWPQYIQKYHPVANDKGSPSLKTCAEPFYLPTQPLLSQQAVRVSLSNHLFLLAGRYIGVSLKGPYIRVLPAAAMPDLTLKRTTFKPLANALSSACLA